MSEKNVYIVAGPNGSGKTTFARLFLPEFVNCPNFVNADLIAQGLAPFAPSNAALQAGQLVLRQIREYGRRGSDFAFETTLSGKTYVRLLKELIAKGYSAHLYYLWVPSPELAIARIKERVLEGGHSVPAVDVRRRFGRSIQNLFRLYRPLMKTWMLFDNSGSKPVVVAKGKNGEVEVMNEETYRKIQESVRSVG